MTLIAAILTESALVTFGLLRIMHNAREIE